VSGPVHEIPVHPKLRVIQVTTAAEMYEACVQEFPSHSCCIMAAAVADYIPSEPSVTKIKKKEDTLTLTLHRSKDILAELGRMKRPDQLLAGFALETDKEIENALAKLHTKNLDMIVLNSLRVKGAGFESPTNQVSILEKSGNRVDFEMKDKAAVAADLLDYLATAHVNW
jgi:phosphopantothenoylcysteine decarboxylase / phosphopantothenate---cysteine ligase